MACNLVEWTPIDTGNCHVTYTIQYENQTDIVGVISKINDATHAWCTGLYPDATAIKMWAVYGGNIGAKSSTVLLKYNSHNSVGSSGELIFVIYKVFTVLTQPQ